MAASGSEPPPPTLVAGLLESATYPHPARRVKLIETHISYVFLAGRYAYKIKKTVNFGFLDYSTLELRRHFCEEEVRLNRRLCPDAYLGVLPIVRDGGSIRIGGSGEVFEYTVAMRRLPAQRMLDRLIHSGSATDAMIDRVAERVADFHAEAERSPEIDELGSPETIELNWRENFEQIEPFVGRTMSRRRLRDIVDFANRFLTSSTPLLAERVEQGRIRDCHGDMRAESICITNGLCIHDRIEFNARFRYGDVASEVAFLAMDLDALGRADLGERFVDHYVALTADEALRRLLLFYKCYRAFVRGKVQSFRLDQLTRWEHELRQARRRAHRYLDLAWRYAQPHTFG